MCATSVLLSFTTEKLGSLSDPPSRSLPIATQVCCSNEECHLDKFCVLRCISCLALKHMTSYSMLVKVRHRLKTCIHCFRLWSSVFVCIKPQVDGCYADLCLATGKVEAQLASWSEHAKTRRSFFRTDRSVISVQDRDCQLQWNFLPRVLRY